jgi:hypothetical protein
MERPTSTAVWLGRLAGGAEAEREDFLATLRDPATRRRLRENYHLTGCRLEADGDHLRIIFSGESPAALANFLKAHRLWPSYWCYEGRGAIEPPGHAGRRVLFDLADESAYLLQPHFERVEFPRVASAVGEADGGSAAVEEQEREQAALEEVAAWAWGQSAIHARLVHRFARPGISGTRRCPLCRSAPTSAMTSRAEHRLGQSPAAFLFRVIQPPVERAGRRLTAAHD